MAAPVVQSSANGTTKPAGLADTDVVVIVANVDVAASASVSGFTLLGSVNGLSTQTTDAVVFGKYISSAAGEPASYTISGVTVFSSGIHRISGVDSTLLSGSAATTAFGTGQSSHVMPSVSPADTDCLLMWVMAPWVALTFGTPSGMTAGVANTVSGDDVFSWYETLTASGATGTRTGTITGGTTEYCGVSFALKPVAAAASTYPVHLLSSRTPYSPNYRGSR